MNRKIILQIICIVILVIVLVVSVVKTLNLINRYNPRQGMNKGMMEQETEKQTSAEDVKYGENINKKNINLNEYTSNVTINEAGEYNITGEFGYTLLINSTQDVTIILNGVNIKNDTTAAIANVGTGKLTIKLKEDTINNLTDGGSSEYDACIYSIGELVIEGNGTLNIFANQQEGEGIATESNNITINGGNINIECADDGLNAGGDGGIITINNGNIYIKASGDGIDSNKDLVINGGNIYTMGSSVGGDAGIDTDGNFEIHGGTVIALGSDMLQTPNSSSKQKAICFNLKKVITSGSNIIVKDENGIEIINFEAKENFKTLIVSNELVQSGTYYIYENSVKTDNSVTIK